MLVKQVIGLKNFQKYPEIPRNLEPLTLLMIRISGEASNYIKNHSSSKIKTVSSKDVNLLHSIDRGPALDKLKKRVDFLHLWTFKTPIINFQLQQNIIKKKLKYFLS